MIMKSASKSKRNELTLKKKVKVIEHVKKNHGLGSRNVVEAFEYCKHKPNRYFCIETLFLPGMSVVV